MGHVTFVPLTGFRVEHAGLREAGLRLPGLRKRAAAIAHLPALGLLTLAGMTTDRWSCGYVETDGEDPEDLVGRIASERPTLVAISALTASAPLAYRLGGLLRRAGLRTVFGGLHATTCAPEARRYFDAVVIGDGEPVWPRVLDDAEHDLLRPVYRAGAFDLAASPVPRFDLLGTKPRPRFTLQTQRGCPLACEFCAASRLLGSFREKPVGNIRRELETIRAIDPRLVIELADDNTLAGRRDPGELLSALAGSGARYFTESDWRIGARPGAARALAASGCVQVLVGVESLAHPFRGMGAKGAQASRVMDALHALQDAGVAVIGCFIVGVDGETRESIDRLARFLDDCDLADVQVTLQTPFPGTALRAKLEREGRLLPDRGWDHYTLFDVAHQPDGMTVADLESSYLELMRWTYRPEATRRREAIRKRVWRNRPGREAWGSLRFSDTSPATATPS